MKIDKPKAFRLKPKKRIQRHARFTVRPNGHIVNLNYLDRYLERERQGLPRLPVLSYEPGIESRFMFEFPEHFEMPSWMVRSVTKPTYTISEGFFLNDGQYVPGNAKWEDIEVILINMISPDTEDIIFVGYIENGIAGIPLNYTIKMLDPVGAIVGSWSITGPVASIDFGTLDFNSTELSTIKLTIRPSVCVYRG